MKMLYNYHCDETGKKAKSKGNVAWYPVDAQIFRKNIRVEVYVDTHLKIPGSNYCVHQNTS